MKEWHLIVLIAILIVCCFAISAISKEFGKVRPMEVVGLWWHINGDWESPPPEAGLKERFASATVLLFCPDGKFKMVDCEVIEKSGIVTISRGDGLNFYAGTWKRSYTEVAVKYRLAVATIWPTGHGHLREKWKKEKADLTIEGIEFQGNRYSKFCSINPQDFEQYFFCTEN